MLVSPADSAEECLLVFPGEVGESADFLEVKVEVVVKDSVIHISCVFILYYTSCRAFDFSL